MTGGDPRIPAPLGATPIDGGVRFAVWAPGARTVHVRLLDASGATRAEHALAPGAHGVHAAEVAGSRAGDDYLIVLDGDRALPDPASRWQPHGVHGASRVVDPRAHAWTDHAWRGVASMGELVIYELHVGTFTPEGTFDAIVPHLPHLRSDGITAIELMPIAEFPGARNWGYDGVHLYAPQSTYGGPEALRRLVDAAHRVGIAVVLDVVYNHLGPEGNYLDAYGPYFTDRYQTPWGRAVNYDGPGSDGVRAHVIANACHWITEYHVDALRLDAIHGIYDMGARHVLAELTDAVHVAAAAHGRHALLVAESDQSDPRVTRPTREHGLGFDAQWADDLHHALHAALTGETQGYYEDFGGVAPIAATLASPFFRAGEHSPHRGRRHGLPADDLPRERFVVCLQNHDQIGNRATGDRMGTLVSFARQKVGALVTLCSGYVPLLFMGEEWGETAPFQYFVSHGDAALLDAVREGRRREFAAFGGAAGWGAEVPDPGDPATFERSRPVPERSAELPHIAMHALYAGLLTLRRREPALRPGAARVEVAHDEDAGWVRWTLTPVDAAAPGARALCGVLHLGDGSAEVPLPPGGWQELVTTDDPYYGGTGATRDDVLRDALLVVGDVAVLLAAADGADGRA